MAENVQIRPKHVPLRTCVACRTTGAKRGLIRIVRTAEGGVEVDATGKAAGRGAYLCRRRQCWQEALKREGLARALRVKLGETDRDKLKAFARPRQTRQQPRRPRRPPNRDASSARTAAAPRLVTAAESGQIVKIPTTLTVKELSELLKLSPVEVIKELIKSGVMASINQVIDYDTAAIVAHDLDFEPEPVVTASVAAVAPEIVEGPAPAEEEVEENLQHRPPVVTFMGHVDHGKTSLLDVIRKSDVAGGEAGGMTQHIGAYQVKVNEQRITFLDTPGHEAFTAMRARGGRVADIAVLVVAADDGVMPQTIEAIDHARAAGVSIIVALNKIDLAQANQDRVKQQLAEHGLVLEEWGGDVICVPVSAKTKEGIESLLANILVVAEVADLKANPDRSARGVVVEAGMDMTRGPMATVLVQKGTLHQGDMAIVGETLGRVKAMFNEHGRRVKSAGPSAPAKVLGLSAVPAAGEPLIVVPDERAARTIVTERQRRREAAAFRERHTLSLDTLFGEISAGKVKELNIILKTDVQGSVEPIRTSLERLSTEEVHVKIIHSGSGSITESDIMLALASKGIIIGFNTRPEPGALRQAEIEGVEINHYNVIYEVVDDVEKALKGMHEPVFKDVIDGHIEVRQVFKVSRLGNIAGCFVRDGTVTRNSLVRVTRGGEVIAESTFSSLRRFKDDVREVQAGYECGITLTGFDAFQEGDVLEFYHRERAN
jgi:translation initiation factor IF-2